MTLGEIIKSYRTEHDLSMAEFAKQSGISKAYISVLENGLHPTTGQPVIPSSSIVKKAADCMHCSFDELFIKINDGWKTRAKEAMDKYHLYRAALRAVGWEEKVIDAQGNDVTDGFDPDEPVHLLLVNGATSFEISNEDEEAFETDLINFVADRIQELMVKASKTIKAKV